MIVCVCNRVNSESIQKAVRDGASTVEDVSLALGVGTNCGQCLEYAAYLIDEELDRLDLAVDVA